MKVLRFLCDECGQLEKTATIFWAFKQGHTMSFCHPNCEMKYLYKNYKDYLAKELKAVRTSKDD